MHTENVPYLMELFGKVSHYFTLKSIGALYAISFATMFDIGQQVAVESLVILLALDFITGIIGAFKTGQKIESHKIFRSAIKTTVYLLMISAAHFTELAVPVIESFADEAVIAFLAITELISVIENCGKMGYAIPKKLLNRLEELRS